MSLINFRNSLLEKAATQGYVDGVPHKLTMLYDNARKLVERQFVLSPSQPPWPVDNSIQVWYNSLDKKFRKTSNWKGGTAWEEQLDVISLFVEGQTTGSSSGSDAGFNNGNTTVPVILIGPASNPLGATTLSQVEQLVLQGSGGAIHLGPSIQSLMDLQAIDVSTIADKHMRFVEDVSFIYAYDQDSSSAVDGQWCVRPNVGVGRWKPTTLKIIDSGIF